MGIDLVLGSPVDKQMTERTALFLPDYLCKAFQGASYKGAPFATTQQLLPGKTRKVAAAINVPFIVFSVFSFIGLKLFIAPLKNSKKAVLFPGTDRNRLAWLTVVVYVAGNRSSVL